MQKKRFLNDLLAKQVYTSANNEGMITCEAFQRMKEASMVSSHLISQLYKSSKFKPSCRIERTQSFSEAGRCKYANEKLFNLLCQYHFDLPPQITKQLRGLSTLLA